MIKSARWRSNNGFREAKARDRELLKNAEAAKDPLDLNEAIREEQVFAMFRTTKLGRG